LTIKLDGHRVTMEDQPEMNF